MVLVLFRTRARGYLRGYLSGAEGQGQRRRPGNVNFPMAFCAKYGLSQRLGATGCPQEALRAACRHRFGPLRPIEDDSPTRRWSEWQDLNLRPPRPERGALPGCATLRLAEADVYRRPGVRPQQKAIPLLRRNEVGRLRLARHCAGLGRGRHGKSVSRSGTSRGGNRRRPVKSDYSVSFGQEPIDARPCNGHQEIGREACAGGEHDHESCAAKHGAKSGFRPQPVVIRPRPPRAAASGELTARTDANR